MNKLADLPAPLIFTGKPGAPGIRLLSALVLKPVLGELSREYASDSGHNLSVSFDAAGAVKNRIREGEDCDVALIQKPAIEALQKEGKIAEGGIVILARSGIAMAVRAGFPKPVIDTVAALTRSLLAARSIAYDDPDMGHASGLHFRAIIKRLGLTQDINAKTKFMKRALADFAARDSAEIVITQPMEILATPGYELAGWLPRELQDEEGFTWAAGVSAAAREPDAARELIGFLSSSRAALVFEKRGMAPNFY